MTLDRHDLRNRFEQGPAIVRCVTEGTMETGMPAAFVMRQRFLENAHALAAAAGGKGVRVVSKSLRSRAAMHSLLALGAPFSGVMCFDPREACWLSTQGFSDCLVAYPTMDLAAIQSVCNALAAGADITLMVDNEAQVMRIASCAIAAGVEVPLCMDLDLSLPVGPLWFGVHRSPLRTPQAAVALFRLIRRNPGVRLVGAMGYEAQIAGLPDQTRGKNLQNLAIARLKRHLMPAVIWRRQAMVSALRDAGAELRFVNGGGTGSVAQTAEDACVTEIAVGSGFYKPHLFDGYADTVLQAAAGFVLPVTRKSDPDWVTCAGGGYIASGSTGIDKQPLPVWPLDVDLSSLEGAGEVQTPLHGDGVHGLHVGDAVIFRHAKAGELCERFPRLLVLDQQPSGHLALVETWKTYRGDGQCFI